MSLFQWIQTLKNFFSINTNKTDDTYILYFIGIDVDVFDIKLRKAKKVEKHQTKLEGIVYKNNLMQYIVIFDSIFRLNILKRINFFDVFVFFFFTFIEYEFFGFHTN